MDADNLNEAYMYCRRVQYMGHYRHNINWMRKTLDVHEVITTNNYITIMMCLVEIFDLYQINK